MARRYLELMEHTDYSVAAEAPRNDGSTIKMPGVEEWDFGGKGWDGWAEETDDEAFVRGRWSRLDSSKAKKAVWDASPIFKVYAEFHQQVRCLSCLATASCDSSEHGEATT